MGTGVEAIELLRLTRLCWCQQDVSVRVLCCMRAAQQRISPMSDRSVVSILHISDLHFCHRKMRDQSIVVDALIEDIERLCIGHRKPDVVIFTGDLVDKGGEDSHEEAYDALLSGVSSASGCSDERIFIVPGNHDLDRKFVEQEAASHARWRRELTSLPGLNDAYQKGEFSILKEKFANFYALEDYLSGSQRVYENEFCSVYRIHQLDMEIVIVNTSAFSAGGISSFGEDRGCLGVPEHPLYDAIKHLTPSSFRVFATHHPFSMMAEESAKFLDGVFAKNAHMHLFGHMHDPQAKNSIGMNGSIYSSQAGAIFTAREEKYIGYSLISVETNQNFYETHLRTFFCDRREFAEAVDVTEQGKFYSSSEARQFWRHIATPVDDAKFRAYLGGRLADFWGELGVEPGARDPHTMFVPPPLKRTFLRSTSGDDANENIETPITFDALIEGESNCMIYAAPEYGRTTLLREVQYNMLSRAATIGFPRLPVFVDFCDIKSNVSNLIRLVRGRATPAPDGVDVDSLLSLGHICLIFDDVAFSDERRISILREFVSKFPKVRYVFSCVRASIAPYGAKIDPEMPVHFDFIELCVLRRRDMRSLVEKFNGGNDVDVVLDRLQCEFKEINLPFTAANGSILMSIYEAQSGFRPINRSVLIEQFIDTTLRKAAVEQSQRRTFDYSNKTSLLAYVAGWMARVGTYMPSAENLREIIKGYLDGVGLNASIDELLGEFYSSRIFIRRPDERVSFRYRAILEYFIAQQMVNDKEFKDWVMHPDRYLQFPNEIQYYSGKLRNDKEVVDIISERFMEILNEVRDDLGGIDLNRITSLRLPVEDGGMGADHLAEQLAALPMPQSERDDELEADLPRDVERRQEVFRPQIEELGHRFIIALYLYSGVVKNMELISDADKRRHIQQLWSGWGAFLHISLGVAAELARHRRVRINGILYELHAPIGTSDVELTRFIALKMPIGITRAMSEHLGSEKLERQLVEPDLPFDEQPLVFEFFRAALIADLQLSSAPASLRTAMKRLDGSSYLLESLVWKIAELRRLDRIKQHHFDEIASNLAEAIARLRGGSHKARMDEKRRQMLRLRREGLMLKIQRIRDEREHY